MFDDIAKALVLSAGAFVVWNHVFAEPPSPAAARAEARRDNADRMATCLRGQAFAAGVGQEKGNAEDNCARSLRVYWNEDGWDSLDAQQRAAR